MNVQIIEKNKNKQPSTSFKLDQLEKNTISETTETWVAIIQLFRIRHGIFPCIPNSMLQTTIMDILRFLHLHNWGNLFCYNRRTVQLRYFDIRPESIVVYLDKGLCFVTWNIYNL